jgi:hypothetical protein
MESRNKIVPAIDNKPFARWMAASRATQAVITLAVMGLDIFVIVEWNKNKFIFNSYLTLVPGFISRTDIGDTPFTGVVMFTVRPNTIHPSSQIVIVIPR